MGLKKAMLWAALIIIATSAMAFALIYLLDMFGDAVFAALGIFILWAMIVGALYDA